MRYFAVKVARFSMEMLVLTYTRARIIGLSIISKENFSRLCVNSLDLYSFLSFFLLLLKDSIYIRNRVGSYSR